MNSRSDNHKYIEIQELDDYGISDIEYYQYNQDKSYDINLSKRQLSAKLQRKYPEIIFRKLESSQKTYQRPFTAVIKKKQQFSNGSLNSQSHQNISHSQLYTNLSQKITLTKEEGVKLKEKINQIPILTQKNKTKINLFSSQQNSSKELQSEKYQEKLSNKLKDFKFIRPQTVLKTQAIPNNIGLLEYLHDIQRQNKDLQQTNRILVEKNQTKQKKNNQFEEIEQFYQNIQFQLEKMVLQQLDENFYNQLQDYQKKLDLHTQQHQKVNVSKDLHITKIIQIPHKDIQIKENKINELEILIDQLQQSNGQLELKLKQMYENEIEITKQIDTQNFGEYLQKIQKIQVEINQIHKIYENYNWDVFEKSDFINLQTKSVLLLNDQASNFYQLVLEIKKEYENNVKEHEELKNKQKDFDFTINKMENRYQDEINCLNQQIQRKNDTIEHFEKNLKIQGCQTIKYMDENEVLKAQLQDLSNNLNYIKLQHTDMLSAQQTKYLNEYQIMTDEFQIQSNNSQKQFQHLQKQFKDLQEKHQDCVNDLNRTKQELNRINEALNNTIESQGNFQRDIQKQRQENDRVLIDCQKLREVVQSKDDQIFEERQMVEKKEFEFLQNINQILKTQLDKKESLIEYLINQIQTNNETEFRLKQLQYRIRDLDIKEQELKEQQQRFQIMIDQKNEELQTSMNDQNSLVMEKDLQMKQINQEKDEMQKTINSFLEKEEKIRQIHILQKFVLQLLLRVYAIDIENLTLKDIQKQHQSPRFSTSVNLDNNISNNHDNSQMESFDFQQLPIQLVLEGHFNIDIVNESTHSIDGSLLFVMDHNLCIKEISFNSKGTSQYNLNIKSQKIKVPKNQ